MLKEFEPIDAIALVVIIGGMILTAMGYDSTISNILIMVTSYYFGKRTSAVLHVIKPL